MTMVWETWWDPFDEMRRIRREMDRMFNNFLARPMYREESKLKGWREPLTDFKETDNDLVLTIELPGIDKNDIQLNATEDFLEIKAETKNLIEEKEEGMFRRERNYKGFYRSFSLPCKIIPEKIDAVHENGVLKLKLPKVTPKKKEKAVSVKVK